MWNSYKFLMQKFPKDFVYNSALITLNFNNLCFLDKWILIKLNNCIKSMLFALENFNFADMTTAFYSFWVYEFCDVYIEATKFVFARNNA